MGCCLPPRACSTSAGATCEFGNRATALGGTGLDSWFACRGIRDAGRLAARAPRRGALGRGPAACAIGEGATAPPLRRNPRPGPPGKAVAAGLRTARRQRDAPPTAPLPP